MAEEKMKLNYVPEIILKKRKHKEESLALTRKIQMELGRYACKKRKMPDFKWPEQFVKEYRKKELDLIKMKRRCKATKLAIAPKSELLFIIRIQGSHDMHPAIRNALSKLGLTRIFQGIFAKATPRVLDLLQAVEPFVTYGYPNMKNLNELIYKKGYGKINNKEVPLINNNIIEEALGKLGILCMEDIVHEVSTVGKHFDDVIKFLGPFSLNKPKDGCTWKKTPFKDGGDSGNREEQINDVISKMT